MGATDTILFACGGLEHPFFLACGGLQIPSKLREIISHTKLYNSKCQNFRACGANQDMLYFFGRGRPQNRPPDHFNFVPGQQRSGYVSKSTPDRFNFVPGPQRSGYVSKFSNRPRTATRPKREKTRTAAVRGSGPGLPRTAPSLGGPGFWPNGPVPDRSGPGPTPLPYPRAVLDDFVLVQHDSKRYS